MNLLKLKGYRVSKGYNVKQISQAIGCTPNMYSKKERGFTKFSVEEFEKFVNVLELTMVQVGDILFDGNVPIGNANCPSTF